MQLNPRLYLSRCGIVTFVRKCEYKYIVVRLNNLAFVLQQDFAIEYSCGAPGLVGVGSAPYGPAADPSKTDSDM